MEQEAYSENLITLVDDEGQEHEFNIVDTLEHKEERYVALVPTFSDPEDQLQDDGELVILKSVLDEDEEFLEAIEDEGEFDEVASIFMERLEDQFDFTYDEDDDEDTEIEEDDSDELPS